jgi:hypothetical protein
MEVFKELFGDAVGLTSLVVIVLTLAIPIYFGIMFIAKSGKDE